MGGGGARNQTPAALLLGVFGLQNRSERLRREIETVRPVAIRYTDCYIPARCFRKLYVRPDFMPIEYRNVKTLIKEPLYSQDLK